MKLFYADDFVLPLARGHRFPMKKYHLLRERLRASGEFSTDEFCVPTAATFTDLTRAHAPDDAMRVQRGEFTAQEMKLIGFPWDPRNGSAPRHRLTVRSNASANHSGAYACAVD